MRVPERTKERKDMEEAISTVDEALMRFQGRLDLAEAVLFNPSVSPDVRKQAFRMLMDDYADLRSLAVARFNTLANLFEMMMTRAANEARQFSDFQFLIDFVDSWDGRAPRSEDGIIEIFLEHRRSLAEGKAVS